MDAAQSKQIEQLYHELYHKLMTYARCSLNNEALAEEAVQETFRIACQKPESLCGSPNPQGWIFLTLKYTIKNIRSNQTAAIHILECYQVLFGNDALRTVDQISLDVMYQNVADTEELQLLIELAVEGKSHAEMAAKRGISISACKKRVQRAKELLQKKLNDCS